MKRLAVFTALFLPTPLFGQTPALPAMPSDTIARTCASDAHRAFDFWVGDWSVAPPGQEPRAVNHVRREVQGCLIREHYWNAGGYTGTSTNWFTPSDGLWRQLWLDNSGLILQLSGGVDDRGRMVLQGDRTTADGGRVRDRITWYPDDSGHVHQIWDSSTDGGVTWENAFHGIYRPLP